MEFEERRRHERFPIDLPARITTEALWPGYETFSTTTRDVSSSGAYLQTRVRFPVGLGVKIQLTISVRDAERFPLAGAARVDLNGSVIRAEAGGIAVVFEDGYQMRQVSAEAPQTTRRRRMARRPRMSRRSAEGSGSNARGGPGSRSDWHKDGDAWGSFGAATAGKGVR